MDDGRLSAALDRAERALDRIDRGIRSFDQNGSRDEALRARVRDAVSELDQIIRLAETEA